MPNALPDTCAPECRVLDLGRYGTSIHHGGACPVAVEQRALWCQDRTHDKGEHLVGRNLYCCNVCNGIVSTG